MHWLKCTVNLTFTLWRQRIDLLRFKPLAHKKGGALSVRARVGILFRWEMSF